MPISTKFINGEYNLEDYRFDDRDAILVDDNPSENTQEVLDPLWKIYVETLEPIRKSANYRKYTFQSFYHSYVCTMIKQLNRYGIEGLLDPKADTEEGLNLLRQSASQSTYSFSNTYDPQNRLVDKNHPKEGFDFDFNSPYGVYNWELFFHGPLLIASKLTQNQKFEEAQKWLHYIFDPTETSGDAPARYWKIKPFYAQQGENTVNVVLDKMSSGDIAFNRQLDQWMKSPFQPHVIARLRTVAYMKSIVMKYVDNLIQWGDNLFRRDTIESLNEATQLYILASQILGPKPVSVSRDLGAPRTVESVIAEDNIFGNSLIDLESEIGSIETNQEVDLGQGVNSLNSILYFCTSPNEKLLGYWDTVADRLFKIRNCQNIEGIERSLALFQPPIDPALLVKAAASGLSIGDVLNSIAGVTLPHYRFRVVVQKAIEICNDVKNLGQSLLSALEKKDAEDLSLLRANQEVTLLKAVREVRKQAINEAKESLASLENARELGEIRREFYSSREYMNAAEKEQLKRMDKAMSFQTTANVMALLGSTLSILPDVSLGVSGAFGSPVATLKTGGTNLAEGLNAVHQALTTLASIENHKATKSGIKGGYDRRMEDWELQTELAEKEIEQMTKQLAAAEIRLALSERELENHDLQMEQSSEIAGFMKDKYTSRDLYNWMITQISGLYFQSYQLAYDVARMAELSYKHELAQEDASFIQFGHWDSLKKGLLAGEKLQADLRRMEVAYLEQNKREFELTKHIPLSILSHTQLVLLRENGVCDIQIPEVMFDLDHPGQYMRRIKSVRLTIPSVTGPYTNVNAKLTLLSSKIRKNTKRPDSYVIEDANDDRFSHNVGGVQSIATSGAQNDSGTFELNFQDERYLPFEGAGAISTWRLELGSEYRQFDYDTISDVILHMSYMAREGGQAMKAGANAAIQEGLNKFADVLATSDTGMQRVFSLKTHFPNSLHQLLQPISGQAYQETSLEIMQNHFPHFLSSKTLDFLGDVQLMVKQRDGITTTLTNISVTLTGVSAGATGPIAITNGDPLSVAALTIIGAPIDSWTLRLEDSVATQAAINGQEIEDIYMVVNYTVS